MTTIAFAKVRWYLQRWRQMTSGASYTHRERESKREREEDTQQFDEAHNSLQSPSQTGV